MDWKEKQQAVKDAIKEFPKEFGLKAFPGDVFTISESASYYGEAFDNEWGSSPGGVMLYTYIKDGDRWNSFAKGSVEELRKNIVYLEAE